METYSILIVDDEPAQRLILSGYLKQKSYKIDEAGSGNEAIELLSREIFDLVISDFNMPDMSGLELLKNTKSLNPEIAFVLVTAYGTIESAVEAMKEGADDYVTKPVDLEELDLIIKRIFEKKQLISENKQLKEQLADKNQLVGIVAHSKKMENILSIASRVADSKATVFIRGESGTGKEVLARAIHFASSRNNNNFIAVNCAALNENLLESELFGHEKGAFTGADKQRRGRFELSDGGTLFLDEIGDLPASTQIKLLRVLQEEKFERVGGTETISVDVRVITATNRNIEKLIKEGKFREDLFYRLNVVSIIIPPLRDRREDIPYLINHFKEKYLSDTKKQNAEFSREAMDLLLKYDYPGNIRELENIIHHAVVLSREEIISTDDLPSHISKRFLNVHGIMNDTATLPQQVENLEKKLVLEALEKTNGNQLKASKLLGISERNLRYRLEKWGMKNK